MGIADTILRLETELAREQEAVTEALARIRGIKAQLEGLRGATEPTPTNPQMNRTDAIVAVIRNADTPLRPVDVLGGLQALGVPADIKNVSTTLGYLTNNGRLIKTGRGRYLAS